MNQFLTERYPTGSNQIFMGVRRVPGIVRIALALVMVLALFSWDGAVRAAETLNEQLTAAAKAGDLNSVRILLDRGADVNGKDGLGWTPLLAAALGGHLKVGRLLLERGADASGRSGMQILAAAARSGDVEIVKQILVKGAKVNETLPGVDSPLMEALMGATDGGHLDVLKLLLDKGADVNWKGGGNRTALMNAAWSGNALAVRVLLDKKADVNAEDVEGRTALIGAARTGNLEVVRLLLAKGADVNAVFRGATFASRVPGFRTDSRTALNAALEYGHKEIADLLRAHGAKAYSDD
jgi:ankyrin repeat protein